MQARRLAQGGLIDRTRTIYFSFDGRLLQGYAGDSLASALLANDVSPLARSIRYHRPRGILSAGLDEPNALVTCRLPGGAVLPNLKATEVPLCDDLDARSQNAWPSPRFDAGGLLQAGSALLGAGFYYKTFMWPRRAWHRVYEKLIRRAAGQGRAGLDTDPRRFDRRNAWCDLLIVGSGPAGLAAASTAANCGHSVLLLEHDRQPGGSTLWERQRIGAQSSDDWREATLQSLAGHDNVAIRCNTLVFGRYDHGRVMALQRDADGNDRISWRIRCRRILLATGASERPLLHPGNDRPGILLAAAVRQYIHRYAVAPGRRAMLAVVDAGERDLTRQALLQANIEIAGELRPGERIIGTRGRARLCGVICRDERGGERHVDCDLLCVSAGWNPNAQLAAQNGAGLAFDAAANALLPAAQDGIVFTCGSARGIHPLDDCLRDGELQTRHALAGLDGRPADPETLPGYPDAADKPALHDGRQPTFVDLQNDVTRTDLELAQREGYRHVELVKRYTTLGMGTDQGKGGWSNAILEVARISGATPAEIGHTTFRPPVSPVSLGALVGADTGRHMTPVRRTPFHRAFETAGCVFQASGDWLYSRYFPRDGERMPAAIEREVRAVRNAVGCVDMSTLGKVEVRGADALEFLQRLYCNNLDALEPGRLRYALMLREDGLLFDDGTVAQLGDDHYLATMTTANAESVWRWMTRLRQLHCTDLDLRLTPVSDHWASLAIAGPKARALLQTLEPDFACARDAFPFAAVRTGALGGDLPCRVFSVSFSGESSFEINVPARHAEALFARVLECGAEFGVTPYGLEALDVLRIEKGHLSIGTEIDGRTTPQDLGLGRMVSTRKAFAGKALLQRPALQSADRLQLVGLQPVDGRSPIPVAAQLGATPWQAGQRQVSLGRLTASVHSPTLDRPIALALLQDGRARLGDSLWAISPLEQRSVQVQVTAPCFVDPEGRRLHD